MSELTSMGNAIISSNTGLDAITRAPIVDYKTKYRCLRIQNVSREESYENWGYTSVSEENYKRFQLKEDDIIVSRTGGSIGTLMFIDKDYNSVYNNGLICLKIDKKKYSPRYIYYCLKLDGFKKHIQKCSLGNSTQENIRMDDMLEYMIPDWDLRTQEKIVDVLKALDVKIQNNVAINAELEAMARTIYDYWFLQFDFPDENGKPYKSSGGKMVWNEELKREIPEGWSVGSLYDIADFVNGLACQKYRPLSDDKKIPVVKIAEMHSGITATTEYVRDDIPEKNRINDGDILFSWSATLETMIWTGGKAGLNQHIFKVIPKRNERYYVYMQLSKYLMNFIKMAEARKTTMGHITTEHIKQSKIVVPCGDIALKYHKLVDDMFLKVISNSKESRELVSMYSFLLPLLLNGQVGFKEQ